MEVFYAANTRTWISSSSKNTFRTWSAVLKSEGYRPQFDPREAHAGQDGIAPGQYSFLSHPQKILVEFHTERTLRYFPIPIDFQDLTGRLMTVEIGGQRLRTFSIEDTLVMLCVHGAKHFWERLGWVLDVAKLATAQEVDWTLADADRRKNGIHPRAPAGALSGARLVWGSLAGAIAGRDCRDRAVQELAEKVYEQYADISDPGAGVLPRAVFRFRLRDGIGQGLRHTLRLAMSPTESDRQTVRLPRWLTPLYMLVRPWRLLAGIWIWPEAPVNDESSHKPIQLGHKNGYSAGQNWHEKSGVTHGWYSVILRMSVVRCATALPLLSVFSCARLGIRSRLSAHD